MIKYNFLDLIGDGIDAIAIAIPLRTDYASQAAQCYQEGLDGLPMELPYEPPDH